MTNPEDSLYIRFPDVSYADYHAVTKMSDDDLREYVRLTLVDARKVLSQSLKFRGVDAWLTDHLWSKDYTRKDFEAAAMQPFNKLRNLNDRNFGSNDPRIAWFREEINKDPKNAVSPLDELFKSDRGKPTTFSKVELTEIEEVEALLSAFFLKETAYSYRQEAKDQDLDAVARHYHRLETVDIPRLKRAWKWGGRDDSGRAEQVLSDLHDALGEVYDVRRLREPKKIAMASDWVEGGTKYVDDITGETGKTDWAQIAFVGAMALAVIGVIMSFFE